MPGASKGSWVIVALLCALVALAGPSASTATTTPKKCGEITVRGNDFNVRGHLVKCRFARHQSKRFLRSGGHPSGWSCTKYPADVTDIAFTCRKRSRDYYAVRA